jgi:uncharacterized protein (TIGR02270 family)
VAATATYIVDILEEHLEELGFLWGQHRAALNDGDYTLAAVGELEERIRARLHGIRVPGERAWPRLLELLQGDDADLVFAAAYSLLHTGAPENTALVIEAFGTAQDELLAALQSALSHGPLDADALGRLRALLSARPVLRAAAAAEVLAFHSVLELTGEQLRYFLEEEDPAVRLAGWRVVALLGAELPAKSYTTAMRDSEPGVATAALEAGAWCGVPGVLPALRQLVEPATPDRMDLWYLLAVLGTAEDAPRLEAALAAAALGPGRFALAGAFGSPALLPLVLAGLEDPDPAAAAAAGAAFTRLTGVDVESDVRAAVPPGDGAEEDDFDVEFRDEAILPDAARARREWDRLRPQLEGVPRLCRGVAESRIHEPGISDGIDMRSRRECWLRARSRGARTGTLLELERFRA